MAISTVFKNPQFTWIDIIEPSREELNKIAKQYHLNPFNVQDCLDPEHLPKYEKIDNTTFLVIRAFDEQCSSEADTVQELTRKVAIFFEDHFVISVHRKDQSYIAKAREKWAAKQNTSSEEEGSLQALLLRDIITGGFSSYEKPLDAAFEKLSQMETLIFRQSCPSMIEDGYYLRRELFVFRRLSKMTLDIVSKLNGRNEVTAPIFQDIREVGEALVAYSEELLENVNSLLSLHLSLESARTNEASHRTNEVMRILTIFSVFFMPLNFITGLYGMNFEFIPGLKSPYGFALSISAMLLTSSAIYFWFKRKGWMK